MIMGGTFTGTAVGTPAGVELSGLLDEAAVQLPECPDGHITAKLRAGCRMFFEDSWAWNEKLAAIALVAGQTQYTIPNPYNYTVDTLAVESVKRVSAAGIVLSTIDASLYTVGDDNTLEFIAAPLATGATTTDTLTIQAIRWPRETCTSIPEKLFNRWRGAIAAWAIWQIKLEKGQPWSDREGAGAWLETYQRGVEQAIGDAIKGRKAACRMPEPPCM